MVWDACDRSKGKAEKKKHSEGGPDGGTESPMEGRLDAEEGLDADTALNKDRDMTDLARRRIRAGLAILMILWFTL